MSGSQNESVGEAAGTLLDDTGRAMHKAAGTARASASKTIDMHGQHIEQAAEAVAQIKRFAQARPLASLVIAFWVGMIVGKGNG